MSKKKKVKKELPKEELEARLALFECILIGGNTETISHHFHNSLIVMADALKKMGMLRYVDFDGKYLYLTPKGEKYLKSNIPEEKWNELWEKRDLRPEKGKTHYIEHN